MEQLRTAEPVVEGEGVCGELTTACATEVLLDGEGIGASEAVPVADEVPVRVRQL